VDYRAPLSFVPPLRVPGKFHEFSLSERCAFHPNMTMGKLPAATWSAVLVTLTLFTSQAGYAQRRAWTGVSFDGITPSVAQVSALLAEKH
jgi:hypothetical protein